MIAPKHPGATVVIMGAGPHSSPMMGGGGGPSASKSQTVIPFPKDFDKGDAQPGDKLDVLAHCKVSDDGEGLVVLSVDGADTGAEMDSHDAPPPPPGDEDTSTPGSRWDDMMKGGN